MGSDWALPSTKMFTGINIKRARLSLTDEVTRRSLLKSLSFAPAVMKPAVWRIAKQEVRVIAIPVSARTIRISIVPIGDSHIPDDGSLMIRSQQKEPLPDLSILASPTDLSIHITETTTARLVQILRFDAETGALKFELGEGPILGLGEGGAQFDRRGEFDKMRSGQGGYKLQTHGGRVPVPWLIGTSGWAMFFHQPYGTFDLRDGKGIFRPSDLQAALPIDLFVTGTTDPKKIMADCANITGHPEMPPRWALGYHQSHRTLAGPEEILTEADTFREKRLPYDSLIFLGTGFCPSGWNTANGSFAFNPKVFPEPKNITQTLHDKNFRFHCTL
jgi:alpha-glucosidase